MKTPQTPILCDVLRTQSPALCQNQRELRGEEMEGSHAGDEPRSAKRPWALGFRQEPGASGSTERAPLTAPSEARLVSLPLRALLGALEASPLHPARKPRVAPSPGTFSPLCNPVVQALDLPVV